MKQKFLLFVMAVLGFAVANAGKVEPGPGNGTGKKDDLAGTVFNAESKKPLEGVTVTAVFANKKEKIVSTDEGGVYAFDELRPGTYKFVFEKVGFKKITKEKVIVKTDEAFQMNIEMIENSNIEILPSPLTDF